MLGKNSSIRKWGLALSVAALVVTALVAVACKARGNAESPPYNAADVPPGVSVLIIGGQHAIVCEDFRFIPPYQLGEGSPGPQSGQIWDIDGAGKFIVWFANSRFVPPMFQIAAEDVEAPYALRVDRSQECEWWINIQGKWVGP